MPDNIPKQLHKYFWDGRSNLSEPFVLRRIIEYASFPDLLCYPFDKLKAHISSINMDSLRTSEKRKVFMEILLPYIPRANNWDEAVMNMLGV